MKIKKINKYIGAEVTGVNLNKPVSEEMKKELYNALLDNVALVIRKQNFSAEEFFTENESGLKDSGCITYLDLLYYVLRP